MTVSTSEEAERKLAEAMRAQATGAGRAGFVGRNPHSLDEQPTGPPGPGGTGSAARPAGGQPATGPAVSFRDALASSRVSLLLALLGGVVLGVALALVSLLFPGVLPPLG